MKLTLPVLNFALRLFEKPRLRKISEPSVLRARFERQAQVLFVTPHFTTFLADFLNGVPARWVVAKNANRRRVILYLHGGAYVFGSPCTHGAMLARLSQITGMAAVLPDYRLAPEHPFPAAVEDAVACYKALLARGYRHDDIALGGDSAGGGLTFALLHVICTEGLPRPAAVFGLSPWVDLTLTGMSLETNAKAEAILPVERLEETRDIYLAGEDPADPRASPVFGHFKGSPEVMLQVGTKEVLLDDSRSLAANLRAQGVQVRLDEVEDTPHVWQIFQSRLDAADRALTDLAGFIRQRLETANRRPE